MTVEEMRNLDLLIIIKDVELVAQVALAKAAFNQAQKLGLSVAMAMRDGANLIILEKSV